MLGEGYISTKEAAEKWGISRRRVSALCARQRIPNVIKVGGTYLIPKSAKKPTDIRNQKQSQKREMAQDLVRFFEYMARPFHDNPDEDVSLIKDKRIITIKECIRAYMCGDFERVKRAFVCAEDNGILKLGLCTMTAASAISTGDYSLFLKVEEYINKIMNERAEPAVKAYAQLAYSTCFLGAGVCNLAPKWLVEGDFSALPPEAALSAAIQRIQYYRWQGNPEAMLVLAQTALAFCGYGKIPTNEDTYLLLLCAVACRDLGYEKKGEKYLLEALDRNLPYGYITPFAEYLNSLGGQLERILKSKYPEFLEPIVAQWMRVNLHWIEFHNDFSKANITKVLTLREYQIALCAAKRMPRAKIARQFDISVGRLNNIMEVIYEKLDISRRSELSKYVR